MRAPRARARHRCGRRFRHARHHRLPLAHRDRRRRQRVERRGVVDGLDRRGDRPHRSQHLPRARRRRDHRQRPPRQRQPDRRHQRGDQAALGPGRPRVALRRRPARHQVRDGREPEALELRADRERRRSPLSGDAHGRARRHPRRLHRGARLSGGVGALRSRPQGGGEEEGRPAADPAAARPPARAAGRGARRQAAGARALVSRRRDPAS